MPAEMQRTAENPSWREFIAKPRIAVPGGSSGLQATEKQAQKRRTSAPDLLLAAETVSEPEGGLNLYLRFRGLKTPAPSECCIRHRIAIQNHFRGKFGIFGIKMSLPWHATAMSTCESERCSF